MKRAAAIASILSGASGSAGTGAADQGARNALVSPRDEPLSWRHTTGLYGGLLILGSANGLLGRAIRVGDFNLEALASTFGISIVVWIACFISISLVVRERGAPVRVGDMALAALSLVLLLVPHWSASWLALAMLSGTLAWRSPRGSAAARGGLIMLSVTVPMLWSQLLLTIFGDWLLQADAILISLVTGTERIGNVVGLADGTGYLFIGAPCSSFSNMSIAFLCWSLFRLGLDRRPVAADWGWCLLACLLVAVVNIVRIGLIGVYPDWYDILHGPVGAAAAGWLSLALIVATCLIGVRRDLFRPL